MSLKETKINIYTPFIHSRDRVSSVMLDVIFVLLPLVVFAYLAHGEWALLAISTSIVAAVVTEFLFSWFFLNKTNTLADGTAVITALLLAFTLSPFTPWYVIAFGASMAVIFGKILWGGLGKNKFNPALVGREFMSVFFPVIMSSGTLWSSKGYVNIPEINIFGQFADNELARYVDSLFYKATGAMGEYSVIFLIIGGLYLLFRQRISWHIPLSMFLTFFLLLQVFYDSALKYSLAGVILGTVYMATDMPSSPSTKGGKLYYGMMIGVVAIACLLDNIQHEYMSYSILILNGFSCKINQVFAPTVWGNKTDWKQKTEQVFLLTISILTVTLAVLGLHHYQLISYAVYLFIVYIIYKFTFTYIKKLNHFF